MGAWCFVWKWTDTLCLPLSSIWQFCSNLALISPSFFSVLAREDHVEGRQHYLAAECVQLRREWRCLQTSTFVEGIGFCFSSEFKCLCLWHEYCNCFFLTHGSVWRIKVFFFLQLFSVNFLVFQTLDVFWFNGLCCRLVADRTIAVHVYRSNALQRRSCI